MAQKTKLQSFTTSWNQTAAWAQTQGIKQSDYYPIYQMDSARVLNGQTPMSSSERTRAILAAHNPNQVTPVPGDKPNPTNILGNAVSDLRGIFTGLAPNHLIPNLFDTVKNTVLHPSTVIKPVSEVLGGVASGNVNEVKSGLEQAAGITGPGSILSWLPGVYVAGEFAQGGLNEVLSKPVTGFIDVAPFAPAGRIIDAAANESRMATIAQKVGMTPDQLRNASLPGMAKSWVLSRKVEDIGYLKTHADQYLVDPKTSKPMTVGGALDRWITGHTGLGKTLSSLMKGMLQVNDEHTPWEMALIRPAQLADRLLTDAQRQEVDALINKTDPRAQGKTPLEIANDDNIDRKVRNSYSAWEEARQWDADTAMASGVDKARMRSDGTIAIYHSYGEPSPAVKAADALQAGTDRLRKAMDPAHKLTMEAAALDAQVGPLAQAFGEAVPAAEAAGRKLHGQRRVTINEKPRQFGRPAKVQEVSLDIKAPIDDLFGRAENLGEHVPEEAGLMGQVKVALDQRDFATLKELTGVAGRRLDLTNFKLREGQADDPALIRLGGQIRALHSYATKRLEYEKRFMDTVQGEIEGRTGKARYVKTPKGTFKDERKGAVAEAAPKMRMTSELKAAFKDYLRLRSEFNKAVFDHPTADWIPVVEQSYIKQLIADEDRKKRFGSMTRIMRDQGKNEEEIRSFQSDPEKMAHLIRFEFERVGGTPYFDEVMTKAENDAYVKSAIETANAMRAEGHEVVYIPSVSTLDLRDRDPGRYGIHLSPTGREKLSSRGFERSLSYIAKRYDVRAGIHQAAKEALQIRGTIEYVDRILSPHFVYDTEALESLNHLGVGIRFDPNAENYRNVVDGAMRQHLNLVRFNPKSTFGFTLPQWKEGGVYLPAEIAKALPKMLEKGQLPLDGIWNKGTNVFRFSILALSPRYTAHVLFGGTFLLALRSSPRLLEALPEAWKIMKGEGDIDLHSIARGATQRSVDPVVYRTFHDSTRSVASRAFHHRTGSQAARWGAEEHIELKQGIKLAAAQPVHWLKALGEMNLDFTNRVANFQRAWAYSDFVMGAKKRGTFKDPVSGEKLDWTDERMRAAAEHHVRKALGDLQSMTPLERATFSKLMPFYGWTKHILEFTGTYPVDHPFRATALTVLANQDTAGIASGLPKRLQFLLFLGSPDVAGNVNAMDVRFMDPLRDVANYATLGGWISALNPIITAPLAMVDPQILFGGTPLYPNVTYDQFYGIETSGSQGSPLTAVEQFVPQVSALDAALGVSAQYRHLAATNPNGFAKAIFQSLNIPFAQVQHLNLKQIAAKNEMDRYQVAKTAATNAFDSGDFSAISGLSSVPDPLNPAWDVTPGYLSTLYNSLLTQYPGTPPAETALPPPSPPL